MLLMISFVAYRSGIFSGKYNSQSNKVSPQVEWNDTSKKPVRDTLKPEMILPGSKSMRVLEVKPEWVKLDSLEKRKFDTIRIKSEKSILSSSKSGKIFVPEKDTTRKKQ